MAYMREHEWHTVYLVLRSALMVLCEYPEFAAQLLDSGYVVGCHLIYYRIIQSIGGVYDTATCPH